MNEEKLTTAEVPANMQLGYTEEQLNDFDKKREEYIKSDSCLEYFVKMGCDREIADKHREELYYIDWLTWHHCFVDFDSDIDMIKEQIAEYFLKYDYSPEAIAEYFSTFSIDFKVTTKDEWFKIIEKVQNKLK